MFLTLGRSRFGCRDVMNTYAHMLIGGIRQSKKSEL